MWIMIMFLILGPFMLIWGSVSYMTNYVNTSKCTATTYGVVVNVEEEVKRAQYSHSTVYIATVEPIESGIFNTSELRSCETDYAFKKDDRVRIYYDPSDPSSYYINFAEPTNQGTVLMFSGVAVTLLGLGFLGIYKRMKKRGA